ncbi:MAG: hypothetical protein K2Y18_09140 [Alphaproteobacteria bacterium]|nr:hypothetical protein [Alphaproteobacteria bacterium]
MKKIVLFLFVLSAFSLSHASEEKAKPDGVAASTTAVVADDKKEEKKDQDSEPDATTSTPGTNKKGCSIL